RLAEAGAGGALVGQAFLGGVDVGARHAPDVAVRLQQVHRAEISEDRHRQPSHPMEHALVVQGRAQDPRELTQAEGVLLGGPGRQRHGFGSGSLALAVRGCYAARIPKVVAFELGAWWTHRCSGTSDRVELTDDRSNLLVLFPASRDTAD